MQCQARQEMLADLDKAWSRCFKKLARAPHWKRHGDAMRIFAPTATVKHTLSGDRKTGKLTLAGPRYAPLGTLKIVLDRPVQGVVKGWSLKRDGEEWYAVAGCEIEIADPVRVNDKAVGIDRGIALFIADSDGATVENIRARDHLETRIARAQRRVDSKKRGSSNQKKARGRVAKLLRLAARQREHHANTQSHRYAEAYGTVVIEKLVVKNMTASASGTVEEPGSNVKQKAGLNRAILDTGWGKFAEGLKYKVAERGGTVVEVRRSTRRRRAPAAAASMRRTVSTQSEFKCVSCGFTGNADVVAAQNILARGLAAKPPEPRKVTTDVSSRTQAQDERNSREAHGEAACGGLPSNGADEAGTGVPRGTPPHNERDTS